MKTKISNTLEKIASRQLREASSAITEIAADVDAYATLLGLIIISEDLEAFCAIHLSPNQTPSADSNKKITDKISEIFATLSPNNVCKNINSLDLMGKEEGKRIQKNIEDPGLLKIRFFQTFQSEKNFSLKQGIKIEDLAGFVELMVKTRHRFPNSNTAPREAPEFKKKKLIKISNELLQNLEAATNLALKNHSQTLTDHFIYKYSEEKDGKSNEAFFKIFYQNLRIDIRKFSNPNSDRDFKKLCQSHKLLNCLDGQNLKKVSSYTLFNGNLLSNLLLFDYEVLGPNLRLELEYKEGDIEPSFIDEPRKRRIENGKIRAELEGKDLVKVAEDIVNKISNNISPDFQQFWDQKKCFNTLDAYYSAHPQIASYFKSKAVLLCGNDGHLKEFIEEESEKGETNREALEQSLVKCAGVLARKAKFDAEDGFGLESVANKIAIISQKISPEKQIAFLDKIRELNPPEDLSLVLDKIRALIEGANAQNASMPGAHDGEERGDLDPGRSIKKPKLGDQNSQTPSVTNNIAERPL
jgi:hypothetical protein